MSKKAAAASAAESAPKRVELYTKPDGAVITFPPARNPGVRSFGALQPGMHYRVSPDEARRLCGDKRPANLRFDVVEPADFDLNPPAAPAGAEKE